MIDKETIDALGRVSLDLSKHLERMIEPYREIEKKVESLEKMTKQITASYFVLSKSFDGTLSNFQKSIERVNDIYLTIPNFENPILEHLNTFEEIGKRLNENSEKTPKDVLLIAQHGWFIDLDSESSLTFNVADEIKKGELDAANTLLIEYYKDNLERIFQKLIQRHSNRKEIITQIFHGFQEGYYSLIIPSVLSQVDGICFDFTKKKFFIKDRENKYLPQVTSVLEDYVETYLSLYLSPLQHQTPIMVREKEINTFPCHLNRHEILHGVNVDYGTEINCLKVISLLKYLSDLLTDLDQKTFMSNKITTS